MVEAYSIKTLYERINYLYKLAGEQEERIEKLEQTSATHDDIRQFLGYPPHDPFYISPKLEADLKNSGVNIERVYVGNQIDRVSIEFGKPPEKEKEKPCYHKNDFNEQDNYTEVYCNEAGKKIIVDSTCKLETNKLDKIIEKLDKLEAKLDILLNDNF